MVPGYLKLTREDLLKRIGKAEDLLFSCTLCPRRCHVNRLAGERGYCRIGKMAEVASFGPHFGEESVLVGEGGSGTIFFCGCNLLCSFCQNYSLSRGDDADCHAVSADELAEIMVHLQSVGCHNINFVTPSHVVPQILAALPHAIDAGLRLPLVYNSGGYDSVDTLHLLDGIVDIYMPDAKFSRTESSRRYLSAPDYPQVMQKALIAMQKQVGDLRNNEKGVAEHGLLVRHLLMPGGIGEAKELFAFLVSDISPHCYLNIMDQYRPCGEQLDTIPTRTITRAEYREAVQAAEEAGLARLDRRDLNVLLRRLLGE